ncbi:MAG: hypothetical protein JO021_11400 [Alphaproteobacteria bacterium]|nr:hypothetical protein [Alphaproteobacteria bacterium]
MNRLSLAIPLLLLGLPGYAQAADAQYVTERGHLMCTTTDALAEAKRASDAQDKRWFDSIKECRRSVAGQKAEVVQEGVLTAKIRVFDDDGKPTIYYTTPSVLKEVRR